MRNTLLLNSLIDPETINFDTLDAGMRHWVSWITFNPSQGVIRSLVNTSSFELISDPELRILLVSWEDVLADYQEEELIAVKMLYEDIYPAYFSHNSLRLGWTDDRVDKSYLATYQFENLVFMRENILMTILGLDSEDGEIDRIKTIIDRIIELSDPNVP